VLIILTKIGFSEQQIEDCLAGYAPETILENLQEIAEEYGHPFQEHGEVPSGETRTRVFNQLM
jgi:hypothetical protein